MAEKSAQLLLEALTRAAADPAGTPLFGSRTESGLFPTTAPARSAARKAIDDGLLRVLRTETRGKQIRELCVATEAGLQFLLEQSSPKQVLEDFVRALERREGEVKDLRAAVQRMADSLDGLKAAVVGVLPRVEAARVPLPAVEASANGSAPRTAHAPLAEHSPSFRLGTAPMNATLEAPVAVETQDDLAGVILTRLSDWAASAGVAQDCPLPELYRSLTTRENPPTIGCFHDCLRQLHAEGRLYLHPWTGPLYALPEPAYALLVGHNVAYYASARSGV